MTLHVCEIIGIAAHPDYVDHTPMEPRRFFLRNGVPHEVCDLGVQAMTHRDLTDRIIELARDERFYRTNGWPQMARFFQDWRHELVTVWAQYLKEDVL